MPFAIFAQVVGLKWKEKHGYDALVLGAGHSKQKSLHPGLAGYYFKHVGTEKDGELDLRVLGVCISWP